MMHAGGGGGGGGKGEYTTLLPFLCAWCSEKGTLNYTFLHLSSQNLFELQLCKRMHI